MQDLATTAFETGQPQRASEAIRLLSRPKSGSLLICERRQLILEILNRDGRILVSELSRAFDLSPITIRKDLDYLESQRLLQRTHGGALPHYGSTLVDPSVKEKETQHTDEKQRIAEAAANLVKDGQCILLDSGTTTLSIARALRRFSRLTIVTNAANIAAELTDTDFEIILTGGTLRKNSLSLVGPLAEDVIRQIRADILFLGVDGFDPKLGVTTPNVLESRVNRAMVSASHKIVVVCDASKFGRSGMGLIVPPSEIHTVITDTAAPATAVKSLRQANIEVILV